jgi:hypothetical protein
MREAGRVYLPLWSSAFHGALQWGCFANYDMNPFTVRLALRASSGLQPCATGQLYGRKLVSFSQGSGSNASVVDHRFLPAHAHLQ